MTRITYSRRRKSAGRKSRMPRAGCVFAGMELLSTLTKDREPDVEQVRVEAGVHLGAVAVRDVVVSISDRPRAARAGLPLDAAAEVAREVELRAARVGHALAEVEEAARSLR